MKKIFLIITILALLTSACSTEKTEEFAPIYISIFTHVEEPGRISPDYLENETAFWELHDAIREFAEELKENNVKYNFQSDWNFLLAIGKYDKEGTPETNNKNLLRYLHEDLGVGIDPHAHETTYNYADVAYIIDQLDVEPSHIAGGFIASPARESKLEYLWEPIEGNIYEYTWQAEALWGAGTSLHKNEEELWISGIWKPKNNQAFLTHNENAPLPNIGYYKVDWEALQKLLNKQEELDPEEIYTQTIGAPQTRIIDPAFRKEFIQEIKNLREETEQGKIIWVELSEVLEIWETKYNSEANIYPYD